MYKALKRNTTRILCALVCLALIFGVATSLFSAGLFARAAEDEEETLFTTQTMHPTNNQFGNSSGSFPKTPDSWTGGGILGSGSGNVLSGVMDLATYANNRDKYKLSEDYPDEFPGNTSPLSPFGTGRYEGTNRNVLLINVRPDGKSKGTAYGYTSSSLTFNANRYYMVKAWVRTGNFDEGMGATIRLNGLDEDVAFTQINTVKDLASVANDADYGWQEFTFYVASSSYASQTATLSLQVGDRYEDADHPENNYYHPATGFALFDNVQAYEIAPAEFFDIQKSYAGTSQEDHPNILIKDFSAKSTANVPNLDFTNGVPSSAWKFVAGAGTDLNSLPIGTYDGSLIFDEDNAYHLTADPLSSNGKYYNGDSNVLVISSYRNGAFDSVAAGVASQKFPIERYHYYRVSAWVKTQEVSGGNGATLALSVIRNSEQDEYTGDNLLSTITSCTGDTANKARGGFSQYSFYVKGSALKDYEASVECRLGTEGSESSGIAVFDNIVIEEISPQVYADHNGGGTAVDIDTAAGVNGNAFITFPDTGITNGEFYQIDTYEEFGYPIAPSGWTKNTPDTVASDGYSSSVAHIDADDAIGGIIPTDNDTFNEYVSEFGYGAVNPRVGDGSVLMLYGKNPTAFCYTSSDFVVAADTPGMLTVRLSADDVTGYGASIVLKSGSKVLATIEKIKDTDGFKTFTFYIEPNAEEHSDMRVEIWLGGMDHVQNHSKLAAGHLYVERVGYAALEDDKDGDTVTKSAAQKFAEFKAECDNARHLNSTVIRAAAYSFKNIDFTAYDYYDASYVKYPYNWKLEVTGGEVSTVHHGIFDTADENKDASVPPTFKNSEDAKNNGVLMLYNATPAASTLTYDGALTFNADTYYKVEVSLKTDIPAQESANAVGATLSLSGTKYSFKDIRDTSSKVDSIEDKEAFQTFTFYIKNGNATSTTTLKLSLGDSGSSSKYCSGRVYINSVTYTDITNIAYDEAMAEIEKRDDNKEYNTAYKNALLADLGEIDEEEPETPDDGSSNTLDWWLIPSILFAVAIVIALVGFMIRKIMEKRANKKGVVEKRASYDRTATLNVAHNENADEADKVSDVAQPESDAHYESFDDDAQTPAEAPKTAEQPAETQEPEQAPAEEPQSESAEEKADEEKPEAPAPEVKAEEPKAEKAANNDSFIDRFDD